MECYHLVKYPKSQCVMSLLATCALKFTKYCQIFLQRISDSGKNSMLSRLFSFQPSSIQTQVNRVKPNGLFKLFAKSAKKKKEEFTDDYQLLK